MLISSICSAESLFDSDEKAKKITNKCEVNKACHEANEKKVHVNKRRQKKRENASCTKFCTLKHCRFVRLKALRQVANIFTARRRLAYASNKLYILCEEKKTNATAIAVIATTIRLA